MHLALFLFTALSGVACYTLLSAALVHRRHAAELRRFGGRESAERSPRNAEPLLIQASEQRGRLATRALESLRLKKTAERLLETAGLKWRAAGMLHRMAGLFLAGFLAVLLFAGTANPAPAAAAGLAAAALPVVYVRRKARLRVTKFEEQFPDCLEFISRSMRAGHAFSVAMEMVHREFPEPLASEFRRTFEEQNLGQPLEIVLEKLSYRIPSLDVRFFVSAVLLQKRTGGNLAELLDKLAYIIRERFKLRARIRAISAQGLMSGRILAAIPAGVGALMFVVNPEYARFFVIDPVGHQLLAGALALQVIGYMVIRKIVRIEV
jgi:tight adherence protein B